MSETLLNTKLHIPPRRSNVVARPRLIQRLEEGLSPGCRLLLLSAPPGSGKTTLIAEWIHGRSRPAPALATAWLSLDEGDNDPARFLAHLVAALQQFEAGLGENALAAFQSPQPPPVEAVLTALLNELITLADQPTSVPGHAFVLVLDDYHAIDAQPVHHTLSFLLDHLPPHVHVVLSTRADPPLPLSRLRSRGSMIELRAADLRFLPQEAAALLTDVMGLCLSEQDIAQLEARTEGWATGLQLAALALRPILATKLDSSVPEQEQVSSFIQTFSGDDRFVADYLVEEVLQRQPESIQAFLLQTSILKVLCAPLCAAVTGHGGAQAILEDLERSNMFVIPLDRRRQWYRYHHLFADLLRHRLQQTGIELMRTLHRRASEWFIENDGPAEAVRHALAAEDYERAAGLIEERAWALMSLGESATYLDWLKALPDDVVSAHPRLVLLHAWALIAATQLDAIEPLLKGIQRRLSEAGRDVGQDSWTRGSEQQALEGEIAAIRATVAGMQGNAKAVAAHAHRALSKLPEDEQLLRGVLYNALGTAYEYRGDAAGASQAFAEAAALSRSAENTLIALIALGNLAQQQDTQGKLHQAADTCREALALAAQQAEPAPSGEKRGPSPAVGMAYVELGRLYCEWNDLDEAIRNLETGISIGKRSGIVELEAIGHVAMVRARLAQRDLEGARQAMREAERLADRYEVSAGLASQISTWRARLWLAEGNRVAVARWTSELRLSPEDGWLPQHQAAQVVYARLLLAEKRPEAALPVLDRLIRAAQEQDRTGQIIELLVLQTLAHGMVGQTDSAIAALGQALVLAEPQGYVRTFVDEGEAMIGLLAGAAARGVASAYAQSLIAAFCPEQLGSSAETLVRRPTGGLVEPLSERELEVLRLVASGLSNREIAQELVITVGTTKWHLSNIYSKLDVHSRMQAAALARTLGLI